MLQRLARSAHRAHVESLTPVQHHESSNISLSMIKPPVASRVDHHSIEFVWERINDAAKGDKRIKYSLEEEDPRTHKFLSVYIGFGDTYKVEGLDPLHSYKYRLRMMSKDVDAGVSSTVTVCTTNEPFNSDNLHKATSKGDLPALTKIINSGHVNIDVRDKLGFTPLMNASQKGILDAVEKLLSAHADVSARNASGKTCLMLACFGGHEEVARRLKDAGAKWSDVDRGGSTAIHWAVDGRNRKLIQWMIEEGAKVDVKDDTSGWTPLIRCAALNGDDGVAEALLSGGANVNAVDVDGKTALMVASLNGYLSLIKKLISYNADVSLKSKHHKTAMEMAKSFDRRSVVKFFEEFLRGNEGKQ